MIDEGVKEPGPFTPIQRGVLIIHESKNKFAGTGISSGNKIHPGGQSDSGGQQGRAGNEVLNREDGSGLYHLYPQPAHHPTARI